MERLPFTFYALIQIAFLFVHFPTTGRFPRILSFAFLLALLFYCHTEYSLQSPGEDYILGCSNGILLATAVYITFLCPEFPDSFHRTSRKNGAEPAPSDLPFAQKLSWMAERAGNIREIGSSRGGGAMNGVAVDAKADNRGPANSSTRKRFVISRVMLSILSLAVFHSTLVYRLQNPSFDPTLHEGAHDGRLIRAHSSLLRKLWVVIVWVAGTVSEMSFLQTTAAAFSVGVGGFQPEDWPSMFGTPAHAYSVRRFWS